MPNNRTASLASEPITPAGPAEFGLIQIWWGNGKGKTTAALGMGFRAAGHGYRVHLLQFMKGGAESVEDVRGEYNAIEAIPGFSYEFAGHYGWHGLNDGTSDTDHEERAKRGFDRARELVTQNNDRDLSSPIPFETPPTEGVHMLIFDEILYAIQRKLIPEDEVLELLENKPPNLEIVLTGGHNRIDSICECADLVTHVAKEKHPFEAGQRARKGTEY